MLHSICQKIWKAHQWPQDWKRSILIPIPQKRSIKECSNHQTTALISHVSKVMLKILKARLQHYVNWELPDVQAWFRKGRGNRDQIANICRIIPIRKQGNSRKTSTSVSVITLKPLRVWIIMNYGKLIKRWNYQTILPVCWEAWMWVKIQQLEPCMGQLTVSRLRKKYDKAVYCHSVYLTYVQSTWCEMPGWMSYKLELRLPGKISTTSDMHMIPL